jgi:hypothetical protein
MTLSNLQPYQVLVTAIAFLMIIQGGTKYFRHGESQSFLKFFVRLIIWGGMIAVTLFPQITNLLATIVGLQGNVNAVILIGFLFIFLMMFKILSIIEKIEHDITVIARHEAIKELEER